MKVTTLHPNGTTSMLVVAWPENPGLDLIKALVCPILGVDEIEHVAVFSEMADGTHGRCSMFVDEIGHMRVAPPLRNELATKIYRAWTLHTNPGTDPESLHWIAGTAVLFDRNIWS